MLRRFRGQYHPDGLGEGGGKAVCVGIQNKLISTVLSSNRTPPVIARNPSALAITALAASSPPSSANSDFEILAAQGLAWMGRRFLPLAVRNSPYIGPAWPGLLALESPVPE